MTCEPGILVKLKGTEGLGRLIPIYFNHSTEHNMGRGK